MAAARRVAGVVATVLLLLALPTATAAAHVRLDGAEPEGDGTTTLVLAFDHGCSGGESTVALDLLAASGTTYLAATTTAVGWTATVAPGTVRFSGPPVPDGKTVELRVRSEVRGEPGETVHLPVVQRCEDDQAYAWVDTDAGAETPAPSLVLTQAVLARSDPPSGATDLQAGVAVGVGALALAAVGGTCGRGVLGPRAAQRRSTSVPS